jgi:hypothetical protein
MNATEKIARRPPRLKFDGRILFLTEDVSLIRRQLEGEDLPYDPDRPLMNNISTDEITPGWVCFYYDETLGQYVYVGLRENAVGKDEVKNGGFAVVVSGLSKGCGSSRETAPFAEKAAGIQLVIARTIEKIYGQNAQNIGLLTSTDFSLIERIRRGEEIPLAEFTRGLDPISASIVEYGGLFNYNRARLAGQVTPPAIETRRRPMNIVEKIIARHAFVRAGTIGVEAVKPGALCRSRCTLLARVCHTDGRIALQGGAWAPGARHRSSLGRRVPRSSDLSRQSDVREAPPDGSVGARRKSRHHAGPIHRRTGTQALRRKSGGRV